MIYSGIIQAKNGSPVPLFSSGKPMHSKYNPQNEGENFAKNVSGESFFIAGIGSGYHLEALKSAHPHSLIIACEADEESLNFCKKNFSLPEDIFFCTLENITQVLTEHYIPALHGNLTVLFHRQWEEENKGAREKIEAGIKGASENISADFSVQSHFGKIWQRNILLNLAHLEQNIPPVFDTSKTAAVIAAGPTLDESIQKLSSSREKYVIFSTDTASKVLTSRGIFPDAIISVDAQTLSATHFYSLPDAGKKKCTVFTDISSPHTIASIAKERGHSIYFVRGRHPLSVCASNYLPLCETDSSSGTVTIAAADIARIMGFTKIEFFGADFSFTGNKPYAKGTYLETIADMTQSRLTPRENWFCALEFRTELTERDGVKTTDVLERYRTGLENWLTAHSFSKHGDVWETDVNQKQKIPSLKNTENKRIQFYTDLCARAKEASENGTQIPELLPYAAWEKRTNAHGKLAYTHILRYNQLYKK